jgi:hypothetical protein
MDLFFDLPLGGLQLPTRRSSGKTGYYGVTISRGKYGAGIKWKVLGPLKDFCANV